MEKGRLVQTIVGKDVIKHVKRSVRPAGKAVLIQKEKEAKEHKIEEVFELQERLF